MIQIYETIFCQKDQIFNFNAHFNRLTKGAEFLSLKIPHSKKTIIQLIKQELLKSKLDKSRLKLILSKDSLQIICKPITPSNSQKLVSFHGERPIPEIKNNNRQLEDQALKFAHQHQAIDALLVNSKNQITEGSISNFFVIQNNSLVTPKAQILPGTTRNLILKIASKLKIPTQIRPINLNDINQIQAAFICNSIKKIVEITHIDQLQIPTHKITSLLQTEFSNFAKDQANWT